MSMSDPIADMLTRVRNALQRQHPYGVDAVFQNKGSYCTGA